RTINVSSSSNGVSMKQQMILKGWRHAPGTFVKVRPCGAAHEGKTYLGLYVGDVALSIGWSSPDVEIRKPRPAMQNPCIWVPDLNEYIFGCESWWGAIETEDDLRQITDADIE